MKEIVITKFKRKEISDMRILTEIAFKGYLKTGNKFAVTFHGSRGYLDFAEIFCEGIQSANNKIGLYNIDMETQVTVLFSEETGVRIHLGEYKPEDTQTKMF